MLADLFVKIAVGQASDDSRLLLVLWLWFSYAFDSRALARAVL